MQIKPGTFGYIKENGQWVKAVVIAQDVTVLGIRVAPDLSSRVVHIDNFVSNDNYNYFKNHTNYSKNIFKQIKAKFEYWKQIMYSPKLVKAKDTKEATKIVVERFERILEKVFE